MENSKTHDNSKKKNEAALLNKSILVVDDNEVNQKVATILLEQMGCLVSQAENGRDAVEIMEQVSYDLVLMDMKMPVMDGIEATKIIQKKEKKKKKKTLIIALTACALHSDKEKCLEAGMDDYLAMPIRKNELRDMLLKYLEN